MIEGCQIFLLYNHPTQYNYHFPIKWLLLWHNSTLTLNFLEQFPQKAKCRISSSLFPRNNSRHSLSPLYGTTNYESILLVDWNSICPIEILVIWKRLFEPLFWYSAGNRVCAETGLNGSSFLCVSNLFTNVPLVLYWVHLSICFTW